MSPETLEFEEPIAALLKEIETFLGEHLPAAVPNAAGH